jgi:hypothetical protein
VKMGSEARVELVSRQDLGRRRVLRLRLAIETGQRKVADWDEVGYICALRPASYGHCPDTSEIWSTLSSDDDRRKVFHHWKYLVYQSGSSTWVHKL